jgi:uncharacterized membrane protein YphA (DoxX/SURF4 family)
MLRLWYFAARSASAPYHLSHWLQYAVSCCLCCFLVFISSVAFAAPRLIVPSEGIAFGEVAVGSNVVGRVEIRNVGSTTVSVSRVKACCGAKAELSAMKIPPNGSAMLSVSLTPQEIGAFSKSIQIACDDPGRPILSVPVSGVVVAPPAAEGRSPPLRENIVRTVLVAFVCEGAAFLAWRLRGQFSVRRCIEGVCRVGLGGLFAYAGAMKLCDVSSFAGLLSRYEMLPDFSLSFFAVTIPLAECVVGPLLVFSRWVRLSAAAVSAMLVVFIIALFQAALRGLDVSCGCFGGASSSGPLPAILRDLILLVPSIWLAVRPRGGKMWYNIRQ